MAITNLTGYSWRPNSTLSYPTSSATYAVTYYTSKAMSFIGNTSNIFLNMTVGTSTLYGQSPAGSSIYFAGSTTYNGPKFMYFTGGTDLTNSTLITWLQANGTLSDRANNLGNLLTDIADSIRNPQGLTTSINAQNFPEQISSGLNPAVFASNAVTVNSTSNVPLVTTAGRTNVNYLYSLTIPADKTLSSLTNSGTLRTLSNSSGKTINSLSNSGTITAATNSGTISSLYNNGGTIRDYYTDDLYTELSTKPQTGTSYNINSGIITNKGGTSSAYGGYINMINNDAYAKISELNNNNNATIQSINNPGGTVDGLYNIFNGTITALDNAMGGTIATLTNDTEGTITKLNNSGTITKLSNTGTIGDINTTSYNGLYGTGTVYVPATQSSSPSTSTYRLNNLMLKPGTSSSSMGAYLGSLFIGAYSTVNGITNSSNAIISSLTNNGTINTLTSNYINTFTNNGEIDNFDSSSGTTIWSFNNSGELRGGANSGLIGTLTDPIQNTGSVVVSHPTSGSGSVYVTPNGASISIPIILFGQANPCIEVSSASTLAGYLVAANAGILFKYTGSTTTYGGVTYTNGNVYTYES